MLLLLFHAAHSWQQRLLVLQLQQLLTQELLIPVRQLPLQQYNLVEQQQQQQL